MWTLATQTIPPTFDNAMSTTAAVVSAYVVPSTRIPRIRRDP